MTLLSRFILVNKVQNFSDNLIYSTLTSILYDNVLKMD